jgi:nitrite reductase (NADH) large subunit
MHFVIVGNGLAGVSAARSLARAGLPDTSIDVYTDEAYLYYPRPKLPDFLAGQIAQTDLIFYAPEWYEEQGIRVHLGKAAQQLDPAGKRLILAGGQSVSYDRLLLANGGRSNIPPFKGTEKLGVFSLRTLADALAIKEYARQSRSAVVIGGGLLGLEAARGLNLLGVKVTVVEFFSRLLPRQLDSAGASILQKQIEAMGIAVVTGAATEEIVGRDSAAGVRTKDGRQIAGEMVLISAGVRSNMELAQAAGLKVNRGVLVDDAMRTSAPDIWAAGDVAEFNGHVWGIIPAALEQARVAAANMATPAGAGAATYVDIVPSNTLKVVGIDLTSIGNVNPEGEGFQELRREQPAAGIYEKLVLQDGKIVGAILLGNKERVTPITTLIHRGVNVSAVAGRLLADDFDLQTLL